MQLCCFSQSLSPLPPALSSSASVAHSHCFSHCDRARGKCNAGMRSFLTLPALLQILLLTSALFGVQASPLPAHDVGSPLSLLDVGEDFSGQTSQVTSVTAAVESSNADSTGASAPTFGEVSSSHYMYERGPSEGDGDSWGQSSAPVTSSADSNPAVSFFSFLSNSFEGSTSGAEEGTTGGGFPPPELPDVESEEEDGEESLLGESLDRLTTASLTLLHSMVANASAVAFSDGGFSSYSGDNGSTSRDAASSGNFSSRQHSSFQSADTPPPQFSDTTEEGNSYPFFHRSLSLSNSQSEESLSPSGPHRTITPSLLLPENGRRPVECPPFARIVSVRTETIFHARASQAAGSGNVTKGRAFSDAGGGGSRDSIKIISSSKRARLSLGGIALEEKDKAILSGDRLNERIASGTAFGQGEQAVMGPSHSVPPLLATVGSDVEAPPPHSFMPADAGDLDDVAVGWPSPLPLPTPPRLWRVHESDVELGGVSILIVANAPWLRISGVLSISEVDLMPADLLLQGEGEGGDGKANRGFSGSGSGGDGPFLHGDRPSVQPPIAATDKSTSPLRRAAFASSEASSSSIASSIAGSQAFLASLFSPDPLTADDAVREPGDFPHAYPPRLIVCERVWGSDDASAPVDAQQSADTLSLSETSSTFVDTDVTTDAAKRRGMYQGDAATTAEAPVEDAEEYFYAACRLPPIPRYAIVVEQRLALFVDPNVFAPSYRCGGQPLPVGYIAVSPSHLARLSTAFAAFSVVTFAAASLGAFFFGSLLPMPFELQLLAVVMHSYCAPSSDRERLGHWLMLFVAPFYSLSFGTVLPSSPAEKGGGGNSGSGSSSNILSPSVPYPHSAVSSDGGGSSPLASVGAGRDLGMALGNLAIVAAVVLLQGTAVSFLMAKRLWWDRCGRRRLSNAIFGIRRRMCVLNQRNERKGSKRVRTRGVNGQRPLAGESGGGTEMPIGMLAAASLEATPAAPSPLQLRVARAGVPLPEEEAADCSPKEGGGAPPCSPFSPRPSGSPLAPKSSTIGTAPLTPFASSPICLPDVCAQTEFPDGLPLPQHQRTQASAGVECTSTNAVGCANDEAEMDTYTEDENESEATKDSIDLPPLTRAELLVALRSALATARAPQLTCFVVNYFFFGIIYGCMRCFGRAESGGSQPAPFFRPFGGSGKHFAASGATSRFVDSGDGSGHTLSPAGETAAAVFVLVIPLALLLGAFLLAVFIARPAATFVAPSRWAAVRARFSVAEPSSGAEAEEEGIAAAALSSTEGVGMHSGLHPHSLSASASASATASPNPSLFRLPGHASPKSADSLTRWGCVVLFLLPRGSWRLDTEDTIAKRQKRAASALRAGRLAWPADRGGPPPPFSYEMGAGALSQTAASAPLPPTEAVPQASAPLHQTLLPPAAIKSLIGPYRFAAYNAAANPCLTFAAALLLGAFRNQFSCQTNFIIVVVSTAVAGAVMLLWAPSRMPVLDYFTAGAFFSLTFFNIFNAVATVEYSAGLRNAKIVFAFVLFGFVLLRTAIGILFGAAAEHYEARHRRRQRSRSGIAFRRLCPRQRGDGDNNTINENVNRNGQQAAFSSASTMGQPPHSPAAPPSIGLFGSARRAMSAASTFVLSLVRKRGSPPATPSSSNMAQGPTAMCPVEGEEGVSVASHRVAVSGGLLVRPASFSAPSLGETPPDGNAPPPLGPLGPSIPPRRTVSFRAEGAADAPADSSSGGERRTALRSLFDLQQQQQQQRAHGHFRLGSSVLVHSTPTPTPTAGGSSIAHYGYYCGSHQPPPRHQSPTALEQQSPHIGAADGGGNHLAGGGAAIDRRGARAGVGPTASEGLQFPRRHYPHHHNHHAHHHHHHHHLSRAGSHILMHTPREGSYAPPLSCSPSLGPAAVATASGTTLFTSSLMPTPREQHHHSFSSTHALPPSSGLGAAIYVPSLSPTNRSRRHQASAGGEEEIEGYGGEVGEDTYMHASHYEEPFAPVEIVAGPSHLRITMLGGHGTNAPVAAAAAVSRAGTNSVCGSLPPLGGRRAAVYLPPPPLPPSPALLLALPTDANAPRSHHDCQRSPPHPLPPAGGEAGGVGSPHCRGLRCGEIDASNDGSAASFLSLPSPLMRAAASASSIASGEGSEEILGAYGSGAGRAAFSTLLPSPECIDDVEIASAGTSPLVLPQGMRTASPPLNAHHQRPQTVVASAAGSGMLRPSGVNMHVDVTAQRDRLYVREQHQQSTVPMYFAPPPRFPLPSTGGPASFSGLGVGIGGAAARPPQLSLRAKMMALGAERRNAFRRQQQHQQ